MNGCEPGQPGEWKAKIEARECIGRAKLGNVQDPVETKIHPQRELRMLSSSQAGSHHRPAVDVQGPGQPGNVRRRQRRGAAIGGDPESQPTAQPRGQGTGATRGAEPRHCRKIEEIQGDLEGIDRRRYRSSEETGQPEDSNTVARKGERFEATR